MTNLICSCVHSAFSTFFRGLRTVFDSSLPTWVFPPGPFPFTFLMANGLTLVSPSWNPQANENCPHSLSVCTRPLSVRPCALRIYRPANPTSAWLRVCVCPTNHRCLPPGIGRSNRRNFRPGLDPSRSPERRFPPKRRHRNLMNVHFYHIHSFAIFNYIIVHDN